MTVVPLRPRRRRLGHLKLVIAALASLAFAAEAFAAVSVLAGRR